MALSRRPPGRQLESRTLVLVGFMGAGKSTLGRAVAQKLRRAFVDTDLVVVSRLGRSIPELFTSGQEDLFRAEEARVAQALPQRSPAVVAALGGGAFENPATREILLARCLVVHLSLSWEQVHLALPSLRRGRPLLESRDDEDIRRLYLERQAAYAEAHLTLEVTPANQPSLADMLTERIAGMPPEDQAKEP